MEKNGRRVVAGLPARFPTAAWPRPGPASNLQPLGAVLAGNSDTEIRGCTVGGWARRRPVRLSALGRSTVGNDGVRDCAASELDLVLDSLNLALAWLLVVEAHSLKPLACTLA